MATLLFSLIVTILFFVIGTLASNFLFYVMFPKWSRRKHILVSSMLPPLALWLLTLSTLVLSVYADSGSNFEFIVPIVASAVMLPFLGALFGIPTSLVMLKLMNWKKPNSVDDIFG